jgi:hypothetical protein
MSLNASGRDVTVAAMRASLAAAALLLAACGPIQYIANVPLDAAGAVSRAEHLEGARYAPYEMTAAQEYLHQSRLLAGYARFHSSVEFGRKSAENARKAEKISLDRASQPDADRGDSTHKPDPSAPQ